MPEITDAQFARLPKNVQRELEALRGQVERLTEQRATAEVIAYGVADLLAEQRAATDTLLVDYKRGHGDESLIPLPAGSMIRFRIGPGEWDYVDAKLTTRRSRRLDTLELELATASGGLVLRPQVTNVVTLSLGEP